MIKIENVSTVGWEPAIRGARNPMNSWEKSDTLIFHDSSRGAYLTNILDELIFDENEFGVYVYARPIHDSKEKDETFKHWSFMMDVDTMELDLYAFGFENYYEGGLKIGPNDLKLLTNLANAGSDESKFRRMIVVYLDVTAPMYWWKEADTYKVGTVRDSCSTMHKIHAKEFTLDDFSTEHLFNSKDVDRELEMDKDRALAAVTVGGDLAYYTPEGYIQMSCDVLNYFRDLFLQTNDKKYWWQMIQLLPSSYNQRATLMLNYEVLANMYHARKNHKLDEWREFCKWIETLPYAKELIIGEEVRDTEEQLRARFKSYKKHIRYLEEALCKELYKAYDMSVEDISEKTGIAVSAVKYFISDDMPAGPLLDPARTIHGETVIRDADTGEQGELKYTIGGE